MKSFIAAFFLLFIFRVSLHAQTCIGPNISTIESNEITGGISWGTGNAGSSDDVYDVTVGALPTNSFTNRLILTGFGFSLPVGSTIVGITVNIERSVTGGNSLRDKEIMLVKNGVTQATTNKAAATAWPVVDATANYGTNSDLWGNTWTYSDINAAGFGVAIAMERFSPAGPPQSGKVDFVSITVCYINILPLQLKSFKTAVLAANNKVKTEWITENELNVDYINLEKSIDGINFTSLVKIKAKGGALENKYNYTDNTPCNGINFYRLKIIDFDGKYKYSDVKTAVVANNKKLDISYISGTLNVNIDDSPGDYLLQISAADGRIVYNKAILTRTQKEFITLPIVLQKSGFYVLKLAGANSIITKKIIVN